MTGTINLRVTVPFLRAFIGASEHPTIRASVVHGAIFRLCRTFRRRKVPNEFRSGFAEECGHFLGANIRSVPQSVAARKRSAEATVPHMLGCSDARMLR